MTAEVAIMNKTAIALAADSAVTITNQQGSKIYNTANKLFTLSKYSPVGIMIYGSASFMGVPWETIIKIYRKKLRVKKFNTLAEYSLDFIKFLNEQNPLFPEERQIAYFYNRIFSYFESIQKQIDEQVEAITHSKEKIKDSQLELIVRDKIKEHCDALDKKQSLQGLPIDYAVKLIKTYRESISKAKDTVFQKLPLSQNDISNLEKICINLFTKETFLEGTPGIVIAGFGETEIFPSLQEFIIEAKVNDFLKFKEDKSKQITFESDAYISAYAQTEMVHRFIDGIDPDYNYLLEGYLFGVFDKYPAILLDCISTLSDTDKAELNKRLKEKSNDMFNNLKKVTKDYREKKHVEPILEAVAVLPKDELAAMAESLVNLTSLKRRMSMDAETVGGPVDVAVISKGDGFVWIKRKHYFKADLNPYFFANYYR